MIGRPVVAAAATAAAVPKCVSHQQNLHVRWLLPHAEPCLLLPEATAAQLYQHTADAGHGVNDLIHPLLVSLGCAMTDQHC